MGKLEKVYQLRMTDEEKKRWEAEAKKAGLKLSDWIRQKIDGKIHVRARGGKRNVPAEPEIESHVLFGSLATAIEVDNGCIRCRRGIALKGHADAALGKCLNCGRKL